MSEPMKFYCAGAIRGKIFDKGYFDKIIRIVEEFGEPKTEKLGYKLYPMTQYTNRNARKSMEKLVAERDRKWVRQCRAVIAEFSGHSTGTGWEICYATRVHRKPTLCLCHESSVPSLMIKQDSSMYTIVQVYSDENEFETYVRCFLEIVTRLDKIDEIRNIYFKCREIVDLDPDPYEIKIFVEKLVKQPLGDLPGVQGIWERDMHKEYVLVPRETDIDFKNPDQLIQFFLRNLILQKRWDRLKSQEIGATFVGGRKPRIIKVLSPLDVPTNLLQIYRREGEDKIKYTREAFTKNVRAFRRIGLLVGKKTRSTQMQRGTKFKDQMMFVKTLSEEVDMISSRSTGKKMSSLVMVTQHLQHLSKFIDRFGSSQLVDFLRRSKLKNWYSEMPEIPIHNIDKIIAKELYQEKWAQKALKNLRTECKMFWKENYSSFYKTKGV